MKSEWGLSTSYEQLPPLFFEKVPTNKVSSPKIVLWNEPLANELNMNSDVYKNADYLCGNDYPQDAAQISQSYAGHQFGHFNMLGDGRAILIGEKVLAHNRRIDLQLKGAGRTPYSRGGDGRAAIGPMVREYIMSEALHALQIPTTRSLAVTLTGDEIYRETALNGAVLTRVAASHLRVGTFEFAARYAQLDDLVALADYAINRHYPQRNTVDENRYVLFLQDVIKKQAKLIAQWQLVGFIHGVMNTDNMTISGETIDYGPCAFMDSFDPDTVYSSIDTNGRYAFGNQPSIGNFNLTRFAETLLPLLAKDQAQAIEIAKEQLALYPTYFMENYQKGLCAKLGLFTHSKEDESIANQFLKLLMKYDADYTNAFRGLTQSVRPNDSFFMTEDFKLWEDKWLARLKACNEPMEQIIQKMNEINPAVIARNHQVERAIEFANNGDFSVTNELVALLRNPYSIDERYAAYTEPSDADEDYQTYCGT